jgi:ribonuclease E
MVKRMLIDATHPEETRVVVVNGTRLEELDVETSTKRQIKGNIYLAKVVRVEPSLQAAFVDYGGNRHGFLAFSEIHPDYFQIPVADRQALLAAQKADVNGDIDHGHDEVKPADAEIEIQSGDESRPESGEGDEAAADAGADEGAKPALVETVGGDDAAEQELERRRARLLRNYKIQEVIKRRQIMLVQVVKEERGNKGAALTTYLSLAGRYCVLMPNTARGGGVSRKIVNANDRRRLKAIASELDCPEGMAVIVRTAGSERSKVEIKRDYEYLLRAWDQVRELTLKSTAPASVYEEASLIKRSIRDLYARDIDEVLVEGDEGYRLAKDYMRMLTPSHAKKVQPYKEPAMPLFHRYQVETQLDAMHSPVVQLKSGGYIVISQTEALVAIDVNSGRATRERHIEETALKTNLEAAEEVARQLRLRDLAGLIVIDFIDMEENRNNHAVERKLKDALKHDRARIQVGKISAFGLLELSRQRLRPSLQETAFTPCPHCTGTGLVRSVESAAMHVLRAIEEEGIRRRSSEVTVFVPTQIALYILNQKRDALALIEGHYQFRVHLLGDDELVAPALRMERVKSEVRPEDIRPLPAPVETVVEPEDEDEIEDEDEDEQDGAEQTTRSGDDQENGQDGNRKRRRRRRRKRRPNAEDGGAEGTEAGDESDGGADGEGEADEGESSQDDREENEATDGEAEGDGDAESDAEKRKRRRGRRGGRRRRRGRDEEGAESPAVESVHVPTVPDMSLISNPDLVADVFERAEAAAEAEAAARHAVRQDDAAAPQDEPEETPAEHPVTEEEPKAKPARRKAPAKTAKAKTEEAEGESETESAGEAKPKRRTATKKAADTEEKPKRTRKKDETAEEKPKRTRKKKDEAAPVEEPAQEQASSPEPVAEIPEPVAVAPEPVAEPVAEVPAEPEALAQAPAAEEAAATEEEALAPAMPARRGWWNKLIS